jgi:hypothetical protein
MFSNLKLTFNISVYHKLVDDCIYRHPPPNATPPLNEHFFYLNNFLKNQYYLMKQILPWTCPYFLEYKNDWVNPGDRATHSRMGPLRN